MRIESPRGPTAAEYLGVLLVVSVVIAAVAGSSVGVAVRDGIERAICRIAQAGDCGAAAAPKRATESHSARLARVPLTYRAAPPDGPPPAAVERARRELRRATRKADRAFRRMVRQLDRRTIAGFDRALDRLDNAAGRADGMGLDRQAQKAVSGSSSVVARCSSRAASTPH